MTRRRKKELEKQNQIAIQCKVLRRKRMCDNKESYYNEFHAMSWAEQYNYGIHKNHPVPYRAYQCPHCNNWHLTTQPVKPDLRKMEKEIAV